MKPFNHTFWMGVINAAASAPAVGIISDADKKELLDAFVLFKGSVTEMALPCSSATVDRLVELVSKDNSTQSELVKLIQTELNPRLIDEMKGRQSFILTTQEADYYNNPRNKWEGIIERFKDVGTDVEESWKCLACSRYTAAVFHSLQVVEVGLIELGGFIGVNDPISGWTAVAQRLKKLLDTKYQDLSQFEKDNRVFLEQVQGTVEALKNAWRNKVSHVHGKLTLMTGEEFHPDIAEEILIATRAFMRRLAEGLPARESEKEIKAGHAL